MSEFENASIEQETTVETSGNEEAETLFASLFPSSVQEPNPEEPEESGSTEADNEAETTIEGVKDASGLPAEKDVYQELAELRQLFFAQNPQAQAQYLASQYGIAPANLQVPQVQASVPEQMPLLESALENKFSVESLVQKHGYNIDDLDDETIQGFKLQSTMMKEVFREEIREELKPFMNELLLPQRAELEQLKAQQIEQAQQAVIANTFASLGSQIPVISQIAIKAGKNEQLSNNELAYLDQIHPIIELQKHQFVQGVLAQGYSQAQLNDLWKSPQFAKQAEQTISKNVAGIAETLAKGLGLTAGKTSIKGVVKSVAPTAVSTPSSNKYSVNDALKTGNALDVTMAILGNIKK